MDRLKKALEKFDLAFPSGLFSLSRLGRVRLVVVRRVELGHFITQEKRADLKGHATHNAPLFLRLEFLCCFSRGKILLFQMLDVES